MSLLPQEPLVSYAKEGTNSEHSSFPWLAPEQCKRGKQDEQIQFNKYLECDNDVGSFEVEKNDSPFLCQELYRATRSYL